MSFKAARTPEDLQVDAVKYTSWDSAIYPCDKPETGAAANQRSLSGLDGSGSDGRQRDGTLTKVKRLGEFLKSVVKFRIEASYASGLTVKVRQQYPGSRKNQESNTGMADR